MPTDCDDDEPGEFGCSVCEFEGEFDVDDTATEDASEEGDGVVYRCPQCGSTCNADGFVLNAAEWPRE